MVDFGVILKRQIAPLFKMVDKSISSIEECDLDRIIGSKYQLWKMIYHPLFWIHFHLSRKEDFIVPQFHEEGMNSLDIISKRTIGKIELVEYSNIVFKRTIKYIEEIDMDQNTREITDIDKILGQIRHFSFHIGMLYTSIFNENGNMLDTIGPEYNNL